VIKRHVTLRQTRWTSNKLY